MGIIWWKNETLHPYIQRFNAEHLQVKDNSLNIVMIMLKNGIHHPKLTNSLFTKPPTTLGVLMTRVERYMNTEEA